MKIASTIILPLLLALPLAAQATPPATDIGKEISQEMAEARVEMRAEMAKAREELRTGNLELDDDSLRFSGKDDKRDKHRRSEAVPPAEITPQGDLLVDGKAVEVDARQRELLLAYREQVIAIALSGIDIGERSAEVALDMMDRSWVGLVFSALTGGLERRVERIVKQQVQPAVLAICARLPEVMVAQQRLASTLPAFQPYANLEQADVDNCERDVRGEFASL
ncbi:hypothetical protein QAA18_05700 [Luteimonas sp. 8-5]|uniref:hypothetical protein n=1 Tax=Luteimonas sp. 8-5 TaxID=3039387 RepID=UPI002436B079|nr:hypothetical protein [Luteimonas sp. 8-5]MDG6348238.1 hypothetical protein [Luteimonas sp. 8-5]